jgi:hypothetical protein
MFTVYEWNCGAIPDHMRFIIFRLKVKDSQKKSYSIHRECYCHAKKIRQKMGEK